MLDTCVCVSLQHGARNPERLHGRIESQEVLEDYEKLWETEIFAPSRDELSQKVITLFVMGASNTNREASDKDEVQAKY